MKRILRFLVLILLLVILPAAFLIGVWFLLAGQGGMGDYLYLLFYAMGLPIILAILSLAVLAFIKFKKSKTKS